MSRRWKLAGAVALALALGCAAALCGCAGGGDSGQQDAQAAAEQAAQPLQVQGSDSKDDSKNADSADEEQRSDAENAGANAIVKSTGKAADEAESKKASKSSGSTASQASCEHDWKVETKTVATEGKTETVEIPATWEEQTKLETVCNECMAVVTGLESEHAAQTGHQHFTPNVPVRQMVMTSEARTETRAASEAGSKEVPTGFDVCTRCGLERQSTEEELAAYGGQ